MSRKNKLTEEQRREAYAAYVGGRTQKDIASDYGVSQSCIAYTIRTERERVSDQHEQAKPKRESEEWVSASIVKSIVAERDALLARVEAAEEAVSAMGTDDAVYTLMVVGVDGTSRVCGLYRSHKRACADCNEYNKVASLLGMESPFSVTEAKWKG